MPPAAHIAALERRGLIRSVAHPPETTSHWELTEAGHAEAAALSGRPGPHDRVLAMIAAFFDSIQR
jgi:manganese/zinc/iron transport system permease protein